MRTSKTLVVNGNTLSVLGSASGEDEDSTQDYYYSEAYFEVRPRDRLTGHGHLSVVVVRSDEGPVDRPPVVRGVDDAGILHRRVWVLGDRRYHYCVIRSWRGWLNPWSTD